MKLLYAEDEKDLSQAIVDILEYHQYQVDAVYDGQSALDFALQMDYDGIILDIMMPKLDGYEVLKILRQQGCKTPILFLSAKSQIEDRIKGLDLGADDYLPKPFDSRELLSRIRAMLRRKEDYTPDIYSFGNVVLDSTKSLMKTEKKAVILSKLEYQFMEFLIRNQGIYISTEELFIKIWGYSDADIGIVWVYVSYLRKKLKEIDANICIQVKRGIGYSLEWRHENNTEKIY